MKYLFSHENCIISMIAQNCIRKKKHLPEGIAWWNIKLPLTSELFRKKKGEQQKAPQLSDNRKIFFFVFHRNYIERRLLVFIMEDFASLKVLKILFPPAITFDSWQRWMMPLKASSNPSRLHLCMVKIPIQLFIHSLTVFPSHSLSLITIKLTEIATNVLCSNV